MPQSAMNFQKEPFMFDYVWLIPVFPAIGFLINRFFGRRYDKRIVGWVACSALGLSFLASILIFFELIGRPATERVFEKDHLRLGRLGLFPNSDRIPDRSSFYLDGFGRQRGQFLHPHLLCRIYA